MGKKSKPTSDGWYTTSSSNSSVAITGAVVVSAVLVGGAITYLSAGGTGSGSWDVKMTASQNAADAKQAQQMSAQTGQAAGYVTEISSGGNSPAATAAPKLSPPLVVTVDPTPVPRRPAPPPVERVNAGQYQQRF